VLARLAHIVHRRRLLVIGVWLVLTVFGGYAAAKVSNRWFQSFSIPGYSAWETNQKTDRIFGNGAKPPLVAVFHANGDVTKQKAIERAVAAAAAPVPHARVSSYFTTGSLTYVSHDRHTTFAEIYPGGKVEGFNFPKYVGQSRDALAAATPGGVQSYLTGRDPLEDAASGGTSGGPSILTEAMIGGFGALIILLFVFGTLPAVLMPIVVAIASILNTFTLVWALTYITDVSIIVQFLIALVGLGVAIDYALLMIFRFREELAAGEDTETALEQTMTHAGHSVIVSGSTVAVGLLSLIAIPMPFIRSMGIGGMLIPAVSVITAITLLPALLSVMGTKINRVRVMPKRITHVGDAESGFWRHWGELVVRRPWVVAAVGLAIVGVLVSFGLQMNPAEAQAKDMPGQGSAIVGRDVLLDSGVSAGAMKPLVVLTTPDQADSVAADLRTVGGIDGAVAPKGDGWRVGNSALVEAIMSTDGASKTARGTIERVKEELPPDASLGGVAPEERDFVHAVYGNAPFVLLFVILLTYVLLARAFRSLVLPLKAVILNLISLAASFGIIVFIFQWGHGSETFWGVHATNAIISWIPLMIFAFLFGLSMDYEVFMLTRMREAYDETGSTRRAVVLGLARTGKLVTSAALVLCLAFFVLSTSPGLDVKQFGIGLAAGIIFDATVIRALLVPAIMTILGRWNWWLPHWAARPLRTTASAPAPEPLAEPT
jgi:putative drug exporter of the RND superfamily